MDRKVILLADVKGVGRKNDVVNVSVGYAANYLLPQRLAVDATPDRVAALAKRNLALSKEKGVAFALAQELAEKLKGQSVTVQAKATPQGHLYGAVAADDIAAAVHVQLGLAIDRKSFTLDEPIKALGTYSVSIKLNPQVVTSITVTVTENS